MRYQNAQNPTVNSLSSKQPLGASGENQRENQLHTLVLRIIAENPKVTAKAVQRLIEADYEADQPLYDLDNILWDIKPEGVYWRSRFKNDQYLAWTSLGSLVSGLRRRQRQA